MIDTLLMDQYVAYGDPAAFRSLVDRHGPSVHRTCRGLLSHDPHAAEDAFQATFLVLVRRAPSIRDPERLNRWLVGVARRISLRARRRSAIHADRERRWAETHREAEVPEPPLFEIQRIVREELARLPDEYRLPLTLCYLEGLTHEQASRRLGWPVGTVKVRLVRARGQLRHRLDRRGVALGVAFLLLLSRNEAHASVASGEFAATLQAMELASSGKDAALQASFPRAFALLRSAPAMGGLIPRWPALLLILIFAGVSTGGIAVARHVHATSHAAQEASIRLAKALEAGCR